MSDPVRITTEKLERMREEAAVARARAEAAWSSPRRVPEEASLPDAERSLRTLALMLAGVLAFLPAALLADGGGELVPLVAAAKNVVAVLFLVLVPAFASLREEPSPVALDMPMARLAARFAPLAVGLLLALSVPMAWMRWYSVEIAIIVQFPVALYLHVPRVRACQVFCLLWSALASATIDERAAVVLAPVFGLVVLAAVLDRAVDARSAAGPGAPVESLRPLLVASAIVTTAFVTLGAIAFAFVRHLTPRLPTVDSVRATRSASDLQASRLDLVLALAGILLLLGAYHLVFRAERREERGGGEEEEPVPPAVVEPLSPDTLGAVSSWPAGPRRTLVERYLEHLARLARLGTPRMPAKTPLEVARDVGERAPGLLERASRLARAFHAARYSPASVPPEVVDRALDDAKEIEASLRDPHASP